MSFNLTNETQKAEMNSFASCVDFVLENYYVALFSPNEQILWATHVRNKDSYNHYQQIIQ
jgi:hypothetical protein